jgi:hypothetical protein
VIALKTHHGSILGLRDNKLYQALPGQVPDSEMVEVTLDGQIAGNIIVTRLPEHLSWKRLDGHLRNELSLSIQDGPLYVCAEPGGQICIDRTHCGPWETFSANLTELYKPETTRLARIHGGLASSSHPILIHLGPGETPKQGFLNIDGFIHAAGARFKEEFPDNYFVFPFADQSWPFPDNSVDYIYHEDFIEHISQINQWQVMAEALRVLKPGCVHRISTPCIKAAMLRHSDFNLGMEGVYEGERQWGHIAMLTHRSLEEMALAIGYSEVIFTQKNGGTSAFAIKDTRPGDDRDELAGNIFADLIK